MALEAAAVGASAALGCGTVGIALYSNVVSGLREESSPVEDSEDSSAPDMSGCAMHLIKSAAGSVKKVLETPQLIRAAFTDPEQELRLSFDTAPCMTCAVECSVDGGPLETSFASCNGEVVRVGKNVASSVNLVAVAGTQVKAEGKTLTIMPWQAPSLVLCFESKEEAKQWEVLLQQRSVQLGNPVERLAEVLEQANDVCKHYGDLQSLHERTVKGHDKKANHASGHGHGGHGSSDEHGCNHIANDCCEKGVESTDPGLVDELQHKLMVAATTNSKLESDLYAAVRELTEKENQRMAMKAEVEALRHYQVHRQEDRVLDTFSAGSPSQDARIAELTRRAEEAERQVEELERHAAETMECLESQDALVTNHEAQLDKIAALHANAKKELEAENETLRRRLADAVASAHQQDSAVENVELRRQMEQMAQELDAQKAELSRHMAKMGANSHVAQQAQDLEAENLRLRRRLAEVEADGQDRKHQQDTEMANLIARANAAEEALTEARLANAQQALQVAATRDANQDELRKFELELAAANEKAEGYRLQAEQAAEDLNAARMGNSPVSPVSSAAAAEGEKSELLDGLDIGRLSRDKKLSARELQALQAHVESVHRRLGAAEAKSRNLEKDKAQKDALKKMLSSQKEHYEKQLNELQDKLLTSTSIASRNEPQDTTAVDVARTTKQMESEGRAFSEELELARQTGSAYPAVTPMRPLVAGSPIVVSSPLAEPAQVGLPALFSHAGVTVMSQSPLRSPVAPVQVLSNSVAPGHGSVTTTIAPGGSMSVQVASGGPFTPNGTTRRPSSYAPSTVFSNQALSSSRFPFSAQVPLGTPGTRAS
eukprot:gb/GFBE01018175.1/.p1 GENE.gb/GFBE01018175.1/~~gb/GFBE01018175.1/.p1  ORF type:complete len:833 (+),score=218.34 gb/GFBE01018175.1/:1-2499(+)